MAVLPHRAAAQGEGGLALADTWQTERIELGDGRVLRGLIEAETPGHVKFLEVRRSPGRIASLVGHFLAKSDIAQINRLPDASRGELLARLASVKSRAAIETGRIQNVQLEPLDRDGERFWTYTGPWFRLEAALEKWEVGTVVLRLEQVYQAFERVLGGLEAERSGADGRITFLVFGDHRLYAAYLRREGLAIRNPALFDPARRLVVVSSDLGRIYELRTAIEEDHLRRRIELFPEDRDLARALAKLDERLQEGGYSDEERKRIRLLTVTRWRGEQDTFEEQVRRANHRNADAIHEERQTLRARLFHEAFHAFAHERLLPLAQAGRIGGPSYEAEQLAGELASKRPNMPLWLAEGLAQIFESALFEADDRLRIDAPDPERLARLQEDLASAANPLRLADVLTADQTKFLVPHDASGRTSERHYLYAWGLAYYLAIERGSLSAERLSEYISRAESPPLEAFEQLVGAPLETFEANWRDAMRRMAPPEE